MPRRVVIRGHAVKLRSISKSETGNAFGWYHFEQREAQLYRGLTGANLAVVALHEITHAVHDLHGVASGDRHTDFKNAQLAGWFGIIRSSPDAWRWLAWLISFPQQARLVARRRSA
jgi:hypothetical protein